MTISCMCCVRAVSRSTRLLYLVWWPMEGWESSIHGSWKKGTLKGRSFMVPVRLLHVVLRFIFLRLVIVRGFGAVLSCYLSILPFSSSNSYCTNTQGSSCGNGVMRKELIGFSEQSSRHLTADTTEMPRKQTSQSQQYNVSKDAILKHFYHIRDHQLWGNAMLV